MGVKESKINLRVTEDLDSEINSVVQLFKEKTGIKVTKSTVIESAIEEGLKIIKAKLQKEN